MIKFTLLKSKLKFLWTIVAILGFYFNGYSQCPTLNDANPVICDASGLTFADLNVYANDLGNGVRWYSNATGGSPFSNSQLLQQGVYYAGDNSGTCGTRDAITVDFTVDPSGENLDGIFCSSEDPTFQLYIDEVLIDGIPAGGDVEIYYDSNLTTLANSTDPLPLGATNYYMVFVDNLGCKSQRELGSTAVFQAPDDPTPSDPQEFCADTNPTVADLDPGTTSNYSWYNNIDGNGDPIPPALTDATALIDGNTYYVQANDFFCFSNTVPATVNIFQPIDPGTPAALDYCEDNVPAASFNLFDELGGAPNTTGVWTGPLTTTNGHLGTVNISTLTPNTYVFTYTVPANGACPEGNSSVTITIYPIYTSGVASALNPATYCEMDLPNNFDLFSLLDNEDAGGQWTQGTTSSDPIVTSPIDLTGLTPTTYYFTYTQNVLPNPCLEESTTVEVVVLEDPNAGLAVNQVFCENDLATNSPFNLFDALDGSQDNNSGTWTDSLDDVVTNPIDITGFTVAGSPYSFNYTIDNGTCSDTETITITVEPTPESGTVNTPVEFCEGAAPTAYDLFDLLTDEDQTGTWYEGTDTTGAVVANPVDLSGYTANTYNFTFDVDAIGTCDDVLVTVQVIINPIPETGTPVPFLVCENDPILNDTAYDLFDLLTDEDAGGSWTDDDSTGALSGNTVDLTQLGLGSFSFTYTITDANGCTNSSTVTLTIEEAPESGTVNTPVEFCEGAAPTAYDLFDLLTDEDQTGTWYAGTDTTGAVVTNPVDLSGYTANTYNFTFDVDAIGTCDDVLVTVQVIINPIPETGTPVPFLVCENDPILNDTAYDLFDLLTGEDAGGSWTDDNSTGALSGNTVDLTQLGLGSFSFTYTITDANGCTNSSTVTLTIEEAPESGTVNTPVEFCEGAAPTAYDLFDLLTDEDQTGTWYAGTDTTGAVVTNPVDLSGYTANTYNFTFDVDAIGTCDDVLVTVQVIINPIPETGTPTPFIVCELDLAANSPLDLFGQLAGEDAGGSWTDDDSTGALSGSDVDLTLLSVGSYNFTYTITENGCTNSSTVTVTVEDPAEAGTAIPFDICLIDVSTSPSLDLFTILSGYDAGGTWNDDDATGALTGSSVDLTLLSTTTYNFTYTVLGVGSCPNDMETVSITINDTPAPTANPIQEFCDSASVSDLTATGNNIQWYNDATLGSPLAPGDDLVDGENYFATQTDATTGCESSTRFEVTVNIYVSPNSGNLSASPISICTTNTAVDLNDGLDGTQDVTGTWIDTDSTGALTGNIFDASAVAAGTYDFTYYVTATSPCLDASTVITVTVEEPVNAGNDNTLDICSDNGTQDLFALLGSADAGGVWSPALSSGTNIFDPLVDAAGTYTYTLVNGCSTDSSDVVITVTQAPDAGTDNSPTICVVDGPVDLLTLLGGTPDASGTWSPLLTSGTNIFDPSVDTSNVYTYTVVSVSPCTTDASAQLTITVSNSSAPTVINATPSFCLVDNPTVADLNASVNGSNITWYDDNTTTTALNSSAVLIDGEDYYATQTDGSNCESSVRTQVTVSIYDSVTPTLIAGGNEFCINDTPTIAELSANINEYNAASNNIIWYDAATGGNVITSNSVLNNGTTYYGVTIDPVTGCESSIRLQVVTDLTACGKIVFPDGFSPNGDDVNDTFYVDNLAFLYPNYNIEIFNRNGNVVFKGNAQNDPFDGKSNQSRLMSKGELPVGVYFYVVDFNDGTTKPVQGHFYLSR